MHSENVPTVARGKHAAPAELRQKNDLAVARTTHGRRAGWRLTFRHDAQAFANPSATWSSASSALPTIIVTARRQGSQLARKNSVNSAGQSQQAVEGLSGLMRDPPLLRSTTILSGHRNTLFM